MNTYEIAFDSVLFCFIYDEQINKEGDPLDNCPEPLLKFFVDNKEA
jgi:hypothetical protein